MDIRLIEEAVPASVRCPDGVWRQLVGVRADGSEVVLRSWCPGDGRAEGEPVAELPAPPRVEEVRDAVPLPDSTVQLSPHVTGLVGLETWLWAEEPAAVTAQVSLRGYTVTATARPTSYRWIMGDGAVVTSATPGSEANPAGRHTYVLDGTYDVRLEIEWGGEFTWEGNGVPAQRADLGSVTTTASLAYRVLEAEAVID